MEEEIKNILVGICEESQEFERVFDGDFLTRDIYFCLENKHNEEFMIIVKKI